MSVLYHCLHLEHPPPPLPPSFPSSSSSFSPLDSLYFCEECDAIRCDHCVAVEIASYFCPSCLFDVPSANVRADKNRCARSCFSCPQCSSSLAVQATETLPKDAASSSQLNSGPTYVLVCAGCKWSSNEVGWEFERPTGIALQLSKIDTQPESVQSEFDALKDHLGSYVSSSKPPTVPRSSRRPTRHISHLTQMAAKALHRDVPGMARLKGKVMMEKEKVEWDELGEYQAKGSWRSAGLEDGMEDVEMMGNMHTSGAGGFAGLERRWERSWDGDRGSKFMLPQRIPLQMKLTKRCPHPNCRHLLIQPDTKTTRFKIKTVALNYIPIIEVGRRRRRIASGDLGQPKTAEEVEQRRRERRRTRPGGKDEDEDMGKIIRGGVDYTFQLAFANPLYIPIQIRLTQPHPPRNAPPLNHHLHIPTQHFVVAALKDAWAYDVEEGEDDPMLGLEGSEGASEDGSSLSRRSRASILGTGGLREKKRREAGVEKRGNVSKVLVEVEMLPDASGPVEFDLEVRYTYRVDESPSTPEKVAGEQGSGREAKSTREEFKTFTFWIRLQLGEGEAGLERDA